MRKKVLLDRKTLVRKLEKAYRKLKESWETAKERLSDDQQSWECFALINQYASETLNWQCDC